MRNRIKCAKCETIIESTYRHDFQPCPCGAVFVDGGQDYQRLGGEFADVIIVNDDDTEVPLLETMKGKDNA